MNALESKYLLVLKFIQEEGPVEQSKIARELCLSLMTINKVVNSLLEHGVVVKSGKTSGKSGRRSGLFKFNPDLYISLGIDINEDRIILSAVKSDSSVISEKEYNFDITNKKLTSADDLISIIEKYYDLFIKEFSLNIEKIAVIGIAPEGIIDTTNGRCLLGTHLGGIIDLNLRDTLHDIFHLPIFIDDPARAVAYYEKKHGDGHNIENFIYIYLGKGVGSGIVIDGKMYRGFMGIAGEIGHIIVNENGSRCKCGNYGCLETVASVESIIRQVKDGIKEGVFTKILDFCNGNVNMIDLSVLKEAADNNDKFSHNILEHVGKNLGKAIALLVNIFNPELILIGGEGVTISPYLLDSVNRVIKNDALNVTNEKTLIKIPNYDRFKDSMSVAIEAFDTLFNGPKDKAHSFIESLLKKIIA